MNSTESYYNYFNTEIPAKIGDTIATGSFGHCRVEKFVDGYLEVRNICTQEVCHVFANDCDFIE